MEKKSRPTRINQLKGAYENTKTLSFEHPIQRKGSQWDGWQKSLFIHSMACDYLIPALCATKIDGITYILDGKQRLTTVFDFIEDRYPLHDDTPEINGHDVSGMYYTELPETIREEIKFYSILIYYLDDATDEEIENMFYRLNNSTPLSSIQKTKALMGGELAQQFQELRQHQFLTQVVSLSKANIRKEDDLKLIVQAMMIRGMAYKQVKKFTVGEVCKFATAISDDAATQVLLDRLKANFDYGLLAIDPKRKAMLKPIHIPMVIRTIEKAMMQGIGVDIFRNWFDDFSEKYKNEDMPYKKNCGGTGGTTSAAKVIGRVETMAQSLDVYMEALEDEREEEWQCKEDGVGAK